MKKQIRALLDKFISDKKPTYNEAISEMNKIALRMKRARRKRNKFHLTY